MKTILLFTSVFLSVSSALAQTALSPEWDGFQITSRTDEQNEAFFAQNGRTTEGSARVSSDRRIGIFSFDIGSVPTDAENITFNLYISTFPSSGELRLYTNEHNLASNVIPTYNKLGLTPTTYGDQFVGITSTSGTTDSYNSFSNTDLSNGFVAAKTNGTKFVIVLAFSGSSVFNWETSFFANAPSITYDAPSRNSWTGATSSEWSDASNWSENAVPLSSEAAVIVDVNNAPIINGLFGVSDLEIQSGASVTIGSGSALAIYGNQTGDGIITATRNTTGNLGYSMVGSPFSGIDLSSLDAEFIYTYDGTNYVAATGMMVPGEGYFVAEADANPALSFSGVPNSGDVTVNLPASTFKILSNPYLAPISLANFLGASGSTNSTEAIYLWADGGSNNGSNRAGDFVAVTSSMVINNPVEGNTWDGNIGSFQGFYVEGDADGGDVTFTPTMQVIDAGSNDDDHFFRKATTNYVTRLSLSGNGLQNEIALVIDNESTLGRDLGKDVSKISGNPFIEFYSILDQDRMIIQTFPEIQSTYLDIPLGIRVEEPGDYTILIDELNIPMHMGATLIDRLTEKTYPLNSNLSVSIALNNGIFNDRFAVRFESSLVTNIHSSIEELRVFGDGKYLQVHMPTESDVVSIHSLSGHLYFKNVVEFSNGIANLKVSLPNHSIYVIRVGQHSAKFYVY